MEKVHYTPKTLNAALLPIKICASFFGMSVFEYPIGTYWPKLSIIYAITCLVLHCCMNYYLRSMIRHFDTVTTTVFGVAIHKFIMFVTSIDQILIPIFAWIKFNKIKRLVDRISDSDSRLWILKINPCYKNVFYWQIGLIIIEIILNIIITNVSVKWVVNQHYSMLMRVAVFLAVMLPSFVSMIFDNYFIVLVNLFGKRFSQLNDVLRCMISKSPNIPQHRRVFEFTTRIKTHDVNEILHNYSFNDDENLLNRIRSVHLQLVRLAQSANSVFGARILVSMLATYCLITTLLYNMWAVVFWSKVDSAQRWEEQKFILCWLSFFVFRSFLINIICGKTSNNARETGDIICELHEPSASVKFREEITDFVLQIVQNRLVFSPCGLIDLNYARIATMIGSITTLLIIVIQIGELPTMQMIANATLIETNSSLY